MRGEFHPSNMTCLGESKRDPGTQHTTNNYSTKVTYWILLLVQAEFAIFPCSVMLSDNVLEIMVNCFRELVALHTLKSDTL